MAGINLLKQARNLRKGGGDGGGSSVSQVEPERESLLSRFSRSTSDSWTKEDTLRLIFFCVGIALIPGGRKLVADYTGRITADLQAQVADVEGKIAAENRKLRDLAEIKKEAESYDARYAELQAKFKAVDDVSRNRNLVVRMVDFVVQEMPPTIWLSRVTVDLVSNKKIDIFGNAMSLQLVGEFVKQLEGAVFFPVWSLVETTSEAGTVPTAAAKTSLTVPVDSKKFSISADVVRP